MADAQSKLRIVVTLNDMASAPAKGLAKSLKGIGQFAGKALKVGLLGAATGIAAVGGALGKLAIDAAPMEGITAAFEGMTTGLTGGSEAMLKALKEGTAGMVSNRDLMQSWNKAAQLVGVEFAQNLPDSMGALNKVAAATGQDVGFLMDSLVTGIGRLSPMILDNLGIQVDLNAAYEAYALELGKGTDELTKSEQQTALMNQVQEKLLANTANMPEVVGTASQQMAAFKATLQDAKDEIGVALLPILKNLMGHFSEFASKVIPIVVDWVQNKLVPGIQALSDWLEKNLKPGIKGVSDSFNQNFGPAFKKIYDAFKEHWPAMKKAAEEALEFVKGWIDKNMPVIRDNIVTTLEEIAIFWDEHGEEVIAIVQGAIEFLTVWLGGALTLLSGVIATGMEIINGDWEGAWETIKSTATTFMESVLSLVGTDLETFVEVWRTNFEMAGMIVEHVFEGVKTTIIQALNWIIEKINWAIEQMNKISGVDFGTIDTVPTGDTGGVGVRPPGGRGESSTANNFNLTINTSAASEPIIDDFRLLQVLTG